MSSVFLLTLVCSTLVASVLSAYATWRFFPGNNYRLSSDINGHGPDEDMLKKHLVSGGGKGGGTDFHSPSPQMLGGPDGGQPVEQARQPVRKSTWEVSPHVIERDVKLLLKNLTKKDFDWISDQIIDWANKSKTETDGRTLIQVIRLVYEKATDDPTRSGMYVLLCRKMMEQISTDIQDEWIKNAEGKPVVGGQLFRKYLLNRCQEDFERGLALKDAAASTAAARETQDSAVAEANADKKEGGEIELYSERFYASQKAKRRGLGLVKFIGGLFKVQMLTERIIHECVKKLLANTDHPEEEEIEQLCVLLTTAGKLMDTARAGPHMDIYFARMKELNKNPKVNSRMQTMLIVRNLSNRPFISCLNPFCRRSSSCANASGSRAIRLRACSYTRT
jgi:hypothetical protein